MDLFVGKSVSLAILIMAYCAIEVNLFIQRKKITLIMIK